MVDRETITHRKGAFFGRRKGHALRPRQAALFDTLLPTLALDLSRPAPPDLRTLFDHADDVRLESGFGGGEHLMAEAERNPRTGFIGIEPFVNGMAKALASIDDRKLQNIRLHHGDATEVLAWLPSGSLARFDLLYPDPWPKRRHWKRRFVQDQSVAAIARIVRAARRVPLCQRHPGLCGLDAGAGDALAAFRLDSRASRRLAQAVARLHQHALRGQGQAPGPRALLSDFQAGVTRSVRRRCRDRGPARTARRVARSRARASRSSNRPRRAPDWKRSCRPDATR